MSDNAETCLRMCIDGLGAYICPDIYVRFYRDRLKHLSIIPLDYSYQICLARRQELYDKTSIQTFWKCCREMKWQWQWLAGGQDAILLLGAAVCRMFFQKRRDDHIFSNMWLYILLSFLFYIPVAVGAGLVPAFGMLMLLRPYAISWWFPHFWGRLWEESIKGQFCAALITYVWETGIMGTRTKNKNKI